jgi:hypothetical protein
MQLAAEKDGSSLRVEMVIREKRIRMEVKNRRLAPPQTPEAVKRVVGRVVGDMCREPQNERKGGKTGQKEIQKGYKRKSFMIFDKALHAVMKHRNIG